MSTKGKLLEWSEAGGVWKASANGFNYAVIEERTSIDPSQFDDMGDLFQAEIEWRGTEDRTDLDTNTCTSLGEGKEWCQSFASAIESALEEERQKGEKMAKALLGARARLSSEVRVGSPEFYAWKARGHDAWSCDLLPSRIPGQHIQDDIIRTVMAGGWDIIFAFPPCTHLAVSGNRWYGKGTSGYKKRLDSLGWTLELWERIKSQAKIGAGFENPIGVFSQIEKPTQIVQPWQFGHGEIKATCLWLDRLPKLVPTKIVEGRNPRVWRMAPGPNRQRDRSVTLQGLGEAMADQWGGTPK